MYNNKKSNTKTMKILIIEDNKVLSDNIKTYLKLEGIDSTQLFNPKTANYELTINDYDLVILDVMLPGMDGFEILKKMREEEIASKVIMLTAKSTLDDKLEGLQNGANDYITKPFHIEELVARVNIQLNSFSSKK